MVTTFWICFGLTLALALSTVLSGRARRRRLHFALAPTTLAMLGVTIWLTERLVRELKFSEIELGIHLWFAKAATLMVLLAAVSGIFTVKLPRFRRLHFWLVVLFLLATVLATATGIWAFSTTTPR